MTVQWVLGIEKGTQKKLHALWLRYYTSETNGSI